MKCLQNQAARMSESQDRVLLRVARFEESIGSVREECRCLRRDIESIRSSLEKLEASERASPALLDTGLGSWSKHALIDRCEWEFYCSSVCVALKVLAEGGSAESANVYGACLEHGRGVSQNHEEAARYYKLSANQGYLAGMRNWA